MYFEENVYHLIQVSYTLSGYNTKQREIQASINTAKEIPNTQNILLTYNETDNIILDNIEIEILPVWKWLITK